jgi:[ribosomal protein S5]-alanine N-acetyltransferase
MISIESRRLHLVMLPVQVLRRRRLEADFDAEVVLKSGPTKICFPAEWPGLAYDVLPTWIAQMEDPAQPDPWNFTLIEKDLRLAIGTAGFKGVPDASGMIEIGYGINDSYHRQGYGSETVAALVSWAFAQPEITRLTAETLTDGIGSMGVLRANGFEKAGERFDIEENLTLFCWSLSKP